MFLRFFLRGSGRGSVEKGGRGDRVHPIPQKVLTLRLRVDGFWGHLGIILGSSWNHFGITLGLFSDTFGAFFDFGGKFWEWSGNHVGIVSDCSWIYPDHSRPIFLNVF